MTFNALAALLGRLSPSLSVQECETAVGVCLSNAFDLMLPADARTGAQCRGRALFADISRVNHSCVPNATHANIVKGTENLYVKIM